MMQVEELLPWCRGEAARPSRRPCLPARGGPCGWRRATAAALPRGHAVARHRSRRSRLRRAETEETARLLSRRSTSSVPSPETVGVLLVTPYRGRGDAEGIFPTRFHSGVGKPAAKRLISLFWSHDGVSKHGIKRSHWVVSRGVHYSRQPFLSKRASFYVSCVSCHTGCCYIETRRSEVFLGEA